MRSPLRRLAGEGSADGGETLIEVIIAIVIMGIVFVAVLAGLATSIATSTLHKQQATEQTIARDFGEYMSYTATYNACGDATSYAADVTSFKNSYKLPDGTTPLVGATPPYTVTLTGVTYWDGNTNPASFTSTCSTDRGAQRFALDVKSTKDSTIEELLQVVKRNPS